MFEFEKIECECSSASTNSENMGNSDDTRLGMSMYFCFLANNELLDKLDPKLRPAMYERANGDTQEDITGHLPKLKFKGLDPLKWPYIGAGYTVIIHADLEFSESHEIEDCKIDKIQLTFKDDGVVGVKLRVYFHPELDQVGPLAALEKHFVTLTIVPPAVNQAQAESEDPNAENDQVDDLFDRSERPTEAEGEPTAADPLYDKAVAAVRATGNPTVSALQTEFKIDFNRAATLLAAMFDNGVIENGDKAGEYAVVEEAAA